MDEEQQTGSTDLPQDNTAPYNPADDIAAFPADEDETVDSTTQEFDDTHPATDTNVDPDEAYHEGIAQASGATGTGTEPGTHDEVTIKETELTENPELQ